MSLSPSNGGYPIDPGFRMPAEWESHAATLLAWPNNKEDWPGKFQPIPWVFAEIIRSILPGERVRLVVQSPAQEKRVRNMLRRASVDSRGVEFLILPLDRGWMRDISPFFLAKDTNSQRETAAAIFGFNGWAKYDNWRLDAQFAPFLVERLGLPAFPVQVEDRPVVLEGGAVDTNGRGTLLVTEECLLDPEVQIRNPGFSKSDYTEVFRRYLGITNILWLGKGIVGDDTHGHVDDLCRFVNPRTLVLCQETDPHDANHRSLAENWERIRDARLEDGSRPEVIPLPMPAPVIFDGQRLPASYANFYIANHAVLVPTFNDPRDRRALGILAELFPGREVVGIHARDLIWGLGAVHCLTHEEPAP